MTVSILIPVHNKEYAIGEILEKLAPQLSADDEILVIDDRSTDNSLEILKKFKETCQNLKILVRTGDPEPYRIASARNILVKEAKYNDLIFLSGDCVPRENFVEFHKTVSITKKRTIVRGMVNPGTAYVEGYHSDWDKMITGNIRLTKFDFNMIGGFDENFDDFWGFEDMDFAYRAVRIYNYELLCIKAYADHVDHHRTEQVGERNLRYFEEKHMISYSAAREIRSVETTEAIKTNEVPVNRKSLIAGLKRK